MDGIFTISLDFELHWGGFEKWPLSIPDSRFQISDSTARANGERFLPVNKEDYSNYFLNTRQVIPEMLRLFAEHEVHVTWATVGMLFHPSREQLLKFIPDEEPSYAEKQLSAYTYIREKGVGTDEISDPFHFAPSLIQKIVQTPHQELATHTFAHYYCNEPGQNVEQFRADLRAAQKSAVLFGKVLQSLVFPRNQFNDQYLRVCFEEGITSVRSNPGDWFWNIGSTQKESAWKRLNRGADAYLPIGKNNIFSLNALRPQKEMPVCIPASRLLRPFNPREMFLNDLKIERIKREMTKAASTGKVYHLWWHPHNFGAYPADSLRELQKILMVFSKLKKSFGMKSYSMNEIARILVDSTSSKVG